MVAKSGNYKWLQQQDEDILEPELPIIDPHHHLWDKNDQLLFRNIDIEYIGFEPDEDTFKCLSKYTKDLSSNL